MTRSFSPRVSPGITLAVVAIGVSGLLGLMSVFASIQGTKPGYCWWWPSGWMAVPLVVTLLGAVLAIVPARRSTLSAFETTQELASPPETATRHLVGEGVQGYAGQFRRAVKALAAQKIEHPDGSVDPVPIGPPRSDVYVDGPGVVQDFDSPESDYGWALCALDGRPVVAVDGKVWNELRAAGTAALGQHPRGALGYPTPDENATRRIDADALRVDLTGGAWGDGRLVRDALAQPWHWKPEPAFSMHPIPEAASWDRDSAGERLRLRVVSVLPLANDGELAATAESRAALLTQLSSGGLARYLVELSASRGAELGPGPWRKGPNRNAPDWVSYSCDLLAPDGRTVLFLHVFMQLGKHASADIEAWVELEVRDLDAWEHAIDDAGGTPRTDLRISPPEVAEFLAIAWHTAAVLLPAAASTQLPTRYTRPPGTQLILATDRQAAGEYPPLARYVDLRPLADGAREHIERMTIAVTAAPSADLDATARLTRQALTEMAQRYEFLDATEASFT